MLDKEVIQLATDGKYSAFSDAIKSELKQKLNDSEVIKDYVSKTDTYSQIKNSFIDMQNME